MKRGFFVFLKLGLLLGLCLMIGLLTFEDPIPTCMQSLGREFLEKISDYL